ncbi:hypothetical protein [Bacillus sp. ISL-18]|uniref:hypothetical protein n=1 Tax=Bacillus sp. ISL-18 TaxID=2819118 RepID=UPI002035ED5B|nr:hypothetical protein [Bacillus sp. ISL-18]
MFGEMLFPFFNAQSAAIFQPEAPRDRLTQLSAVRLLFLRVTMPLGILFASSSFLDLSTRQIYAIIGMVTVLSGLLHLFASFSQPDNDLLANKKQVTKKRKFRNL